MPKKPHTITEAQAQQAHAALAQHQPPQPAGVILQAAHIAAVRLESLLTTEQAAAVLGIDPKTLANDRCTAELGMPFVKLGGRAVRYRASDLAAFIEARVVRPVQVGAPT